MGMDKEKRLSFFHFAFLGISTFTLYCSLIIALQTQPFSDFDFYYQTALALKSEHMVNPFYKYFYAPGYPYLLHILFQLFANDSIFIPQLFNALGLTYLSLLLIHHNFVERNFLKLIGFLILAFNINFLSLVSVLCSEIPFAIFFTSGLVLIWIGCRRIWEPCPRSTTKTNLILFAGGAVLGVSQYIRPVTMPFLTLLSFFFLILLRFIATPRTVWLRSFPKTFRHFSLCWAGFLGTALVLYGLSGYGLTVQPLQNGFWNIYVGFNLDSKGMWNSEDSKLIGEIGNRTNWNGKEMNKEFLQIVKERVGKNWFKQLKMIPQKLVILFNLSGSTQWALQNSKIRNPSRIYQVSRHLLFFNLLILGICVLGFFQVFFKKKISLTELFVLSLTLTAIVNSLLHAYLLEVQGRYANHLLLIFFWLFPFYLVGMLRMIRTKKNEM